MYFMLSMLSVKASVVSANLHREFSKIKQNFLIETSAAVSTVCAKGSSAAKNLPIKDWKYLKGYNWKRNRVSFTDPIRCLLGTKAFKATFGIQSLDCEGIMVIDSLGKIGAIIDLSNRVILSHGEDIGLFTVAASHQVAAVNAPLDIVLPDWDLNEKEVTQQHLAAFAKNKMHCGKRKNIIRILGPDPKPLHQYKYPQQTEESLGRPVSRLKNKECW